MGVKGCQSRGVMGGGGGVKRCKSTGGNGS